MYTTLHSVTHKRYYIGLNFFVVNKMPNKNKWNLKVFGLWTKICVSEGLSN